jgi:hypothetical protein
VGGHLLVRQTTSFEAGGPVSDGRLIFLPWASTGSASAVAELDARSAGPVAQPSAEIEITRPTWAELFGPAFFDPSPRRQAEPWLAMPQR